MNFKIERIGERVRGSKRQYVPYKISCICECGRNLERDYNVDCLMHPIFWR